MNTTNDCNLSRRGIFRLGGIVGGLLLPFAGGKVLRLADSAAAAAVPVIQSDVAVSPLVQRFRDEALKLFEIKKACGVVEIAPGGAHYNQSQIMEEAAKAVIAQPVRDFGDLRGLAEVAWLGAPKEELWEGPFGYTGKIYQLDSPPVRYGWAPRTWDWSVAANAALIEGVLELTNGNRFDPRLAHDQWREPRSHAAA